MIKKQFLACAAMLGALLIATPAYAQQSTNVCTPPVKAITDSDLTTARSFTVSRSSYTSSFGVLKVRINHDDSASGTVTRVDMTCVEIAEDGSTEYIIQSCTVASGVCTSDDNDFQKTVSGTEDKKWVWRVDVEALPDLKCSFDAGAGTGHADDRLDVEYQLCTKG